MKDRLKEIRKTNQAWKTQDDFAEFLGISKSNLSSYEAGRRMPSDAVVQLICQKCNINEEWLRTGNGEMFNSRTRNQEIGAFANEVMMLDDDNFKKKFIDALIKLDSKDWEHLEEIAKKLLSN
jgi:transcriptional regulator with XRE-family HTH domain